MFCFFSIYHKLLKPVLAIQAPWKRSNKGEKIKQGEEAGKQQGVGNGARRASRGSQLVSDGDPSSAEERAGWSPCDARAG